MNDYPPSRRLSDEEVQSFSSEHWRFVKGIAIAAGISMLFWWAVVCWWSM